MPRARRVRYISDEDDDEDETPGSRRRDDDEDDPPKRKKPRKKRRRSAGFSLSWTKINLALLGADLVLAVLGFMAWGAYGEVGFALPILAQLLFGVLFYAIGRIVTIVVAFMDSVAQGILVLLVPLYSLYYLCKNPASHGPFCLGVVGILYMGTGIGEDALIELRSGRLPEQVQADPPPQVRPPQVEIGRQPFQPFQPAPNLRPPVAQPRQPVRPQQPPPVTAAEIDQMLADIETGDGTRSNVSARRLSETKPIAEFQPKVIARAAVGAKSPNKWNREASRSVLVSWAIEKDIPLLIEIGNTLKGGDLGVFAMGLGKFKDERLIPTIVRGVREPDGGGFAARGLRDAGPIAEPLTLPLLKEKGFYTLLFVLEALSDVGTEKSLPALQAIVDANRGDSRHINQARQAIADIRRRLNKG